MVEQIDLRLKEWGSFARRANNPGLGFKTESVEYRMMRLGPDGAAIRYEPESVGVCWPDYIEEIDTAVKSLPCLQRKVIIRFYEKRRKPTDIAKCMGINRQQFYKILDQAKWWIKAKTHC